MERKNAAPAQIALTWVVAQKPWIVPITGTTRLHRLIENIVAVNIEFTKEEIQELTAASGQVKVMGVSYTEVQEAGRRCLPGQAFSLGRTAGDRGEPARTEV